MKSTCFSQSLHDQSRHHISYYQVVSAQATEPHWGWWTESSDNQTESSVKGQEGLGIVSLIQETLASQRKPSDLKRWLQSSYGYQGAVKSY